MDDWTPDAVDRLSLDDRMRKFPARSSLWFDTEDSGTQLHLTSEHGGWRCKAIYSDLTVTRDIPFEPMFESVAAAFAYYENARGRGTALT